MAHKKKIVFISNNSPPVIDGVGDYTYHLGNCLSKDVEVFYLNKQTLEIHNWSICSLRQLTNKIEALKPDLVSLQYVPFGFHAKGLPFSLLIFWLFLKIKRYKLQITFHEVAIGFNKNSVRQNLAAIGQRIIAWGLCFLARDVFTSVGLYYRMLKPFNGNIKQVNIGANLFKERTTKESKQEISIVIFNNRITDEFLEAMQRLKKVVDVKFKCICIGKQPANHVYLTKKIKDLNLFDNLKIYPQSDAETITDYLYSGDIYVQPEWTDENGNGGISLKSGVLIAAMGASLPIITKKGMMTDENLLNEGSGILFFNNADQLAESLITLCHQVNLRYSLGKSAFAFYQQNCTWDVISTKYLNLING